MKIAIAVIISMVLFSCKLFAVIEVETGQNKIIIKIDNPETGIKYVDSDGNKHLGILNTFYASKNWGSGMSIDELRIPLAVPEELFNSKNLNKYIRFTFEEKTVINQDFITSFKSSVLNESCNLVKYGSIRGIKTAVLVINPFQFDKKSGKAFIFNKIRVELSLPVTIQVSDIKNLKDAFMYANLVNPEHVGALEKTTNKIKSKNDKLQEEYWYKPDKVYVKIITSRDGLASAMAGDIISANSYFSGKPLKDLVLLHRGKQVPLFIKNDADGILNAGDELIFVGSRAAGDTLWYDHYTADEPFFLYYDENSNPLRFTDFPQADGVPRPIEYVEINRHIEYNKTHFWGFDLMNPENVDTEGWYWKEINSSNDNKFNDSSLFVVPYGSQPLDLSIKVASIKTNDSISGHKLSMSLNNKHLSEKEYKLKVKDNINVKPGTESLVAGLNKISVTNKPYLNKQNQPYEPNSVMIDYYELRGKVLPVSDSGMAEFSVNGLSNPGGLEIMNFTNSEVIIADLNNNFINARPAYKKGINIVAGANSSNGYATISLDRHRISESYRTGFHLAVLRSPGFTEFEYKYFDPASQELSSYLTGLPQGSLVAIVYNNPSKPPADKITLLKLYGSNQVENAGPSNPWFFSFTKNTSDFLSEKTGTAGTLSESVFYPTELGGSYNVNIDLASGKDYHILASDRNNIEKTRVISVNNTDWRNTSNKADVIILYNKKFRKFADTLLEYRSKTHPQYNVVAIDVEDIYNEFYNGRKSPHAIKEFLTFAYNNWQKKPLFLTLIGDATYDPQKILSNTINEDYLPTWGSPNSDFWYSLIDGDDYLPELIVGRISVNNDLEAFSYFNKLREYETTPLNLWMKKFLFLSGGYDVFQKDEFSSALQSAGDIITSADMAVNKELCVDTAYVRKRDDTIVGESDANLILKNINEGTGWTIFYGHGSQRVFDMDGWTVDMFKNKNRYGLLSTLSCNTGAFASSDIRTRNEDFIFEPNVGFVAASGATATGRTNVISDYLYKLFYLIKNPTYKYRTYGELIHLAKIGMNPNSDVVRFHILEYLFIGDPMVMLRIPFESEIYTYNSDLKITNKNENSIIVESDSFAIVTGIAKNQSLYKIDLPVKVKLAHNYGSFSEEFLVEINDLCKFDYYNYKINIKDKPGIHNVTITLDPDEELDDPDRSNNIITASFEVFNQNLLPIEPMSYWDMNYSKPVFRIINPLDNGIDNIYSYEFKINSDSVAGNTVTTSANDFSIHENYIEWKSAQDLVSGKNYYLLVRSVDQNTDVKSSWLIIPFWVNDKYDKNRTVLKLKSDDLSKVSVDNMIYEKNENSLRIVISYLDHPYSVLGVSGTRGPGSDNALRAQEMVYDGNRFLYTPQPLPGMNVALVSTKDYKVRYSSRWNWNMWLAWGEDPQKNTRSIEFVNFLRDSVKDDDYLFLATCDQAFFLPDTLNKYNSVGSLDTIKAELKKFGSLLADSLKNGSSFAMVGKRGEKYANEAFDYFYSDSCEFCGDTAKVTGFIRERFLKGKMTTPYFGNAKKWNKINISGYFPTDSVKAEFLVYGIPKDGGMPELLIIDSLQSIDISSIDALVYPRIAVAISLERYTTLVEPFIDEISVDFVTAPELAVIKSTLKTSNSMIMRGETIQISGDAENISLRTPAENSIFTALITSDDGGIIDNLTKSVLINTGSMVNYVFTNVTDYYKEKNVLEFIINNNDSINEQYGFNNFGRDEFYLFEDSLKPYVEVYFDGVRLKDGDFVARKPKVEVKLFDNSKLTVKNKEDLKVLINSNYNKIVNLPDYEFISLPRESTPEKANVKFTVDTIEYKHNIISVWFTDGSGNRDSTDISFYISINGFINNAENIPNPISDEAEFKFDYKGPKQGAIGRVNIYNLKGQKIRELKGIVNLGMNSIPWDGRDESGNSLPSGAYFYVIFVDTDVYVEQVYGKCIITH